jgi:phage internal scaffolding protein
LAKTIGVLIMIRKAYEPIGETRRPVITLNKEPSMTKQSHAERLDVNNIIKRYNRTGVLQQATDFEGVYGEFTSYDLREAIEKVEKSNQIFMEVPSEIRARFENDPGAFIDFATNPTNVHQMRDWGLAKPEPKKTPNVDVGDADAQPAPPVEPIIAPKE